MKKVSKFWYCIIILLFGSIGIHKLYAGHTILGIIYMLLCWTGISEILTVIDLISAIMKEADENGFICI